jgi:ACS family glucarate transporter-like MFS transporter
MDKRPAGAGAMTRVRWLILAMLFAATTVNYADRATLSIAGTALGKDLGLSPVTLGYAFSAFGWSYVLAQLPGGWLLDRFGSKKVYFASILAWSAFTALQGGISLLTATAGSAVVALFALRLLVGLAEAPSFPANGRIVAAWFPAHERGTASAIFNSAQYFATVLFAPLMGWVTHAFGWPAVFYAMGAIGIALSAVWLRVVDNPATHPRADAAEVAYIEAGGGLVRMDQAEHTHSGTFIDPTPRGAHVRQLLRNRMLLGVYVGQYGINTLTWFFLTWFPIYLVKERGFSILAAGVVSALPAVCAFCGGVLGGVLSDALIRRGRSLTLARKLPIVVGMGLSMSIVACNAAHSSALVVAIMALAFFGKGLGALGWAVVADTSPRQIAGLSGAVFNTFGAVAGITTPIAIGYLVDRTGSFGAALVFVAAHALLTVLCYLVVVGDIRRVSLAAPDR